MFAVGTKSPSLPYNTKSTLQALLKTRRQLLNENEKVPVKVSGDQLMNGLFETDSTNICHFKPDRIIDTGNTTSPQLNSTSKDVDQNEDFTYSQKLFHIADGNLYSIFSPLQGRSYGMKPSFLRKQKCTVQECRGRGRKVLRKGLKFHNFLPSESVTSEKGMALLDDQWKVHSECRLREEHGTKQITVSNWFHNVKQPVDDDCKEATTGSRELISLSDSTLRNSIDEEKSRNPAYEEHIEKSYLAGRMLQEPGVLNHVPSPNQNILGHPHLSALRIPSKSITGKGSFLNSLLSSVASSHLATASSSSDLKGHRRVIIRDGQKHRRKPEQTRRIVPYTKYLSLMEETETAPLDLSLHSNSTQVSPFNNFWSHDPSNGIKSPMANGVPTMPSSPSPYISNVPCPVADKHGFRTKREKHYQTEIQNDRHRAQPCYSNTSSYYCSLPFKENSQVTLPSTMTANDALSLPKPQYFAPNSMGNGSPVPGAGKETGFKYGATSPPNNVDYTRHYDSAKILSVTKPRKKSQRSVIKQKLEDTFKQNGFLVKTKQVSDGEATFCKFRQLRKYTRYYFKSMQQHLPDEVRKMWKGFLPPKTVLPPISGMITNCIDETTT